jgi:AcrR family transcriptional regulator
MHLCQSLDKKIGRNNKKQSNERRIILKVSEKQSIRRREIAETIRDILTEGGLEELTVDDICRANGISKGTFYHYFTSKEQLLDELSCYPIDDFFET